MYAIVLATTLLAHTPDNHPSGELTAHEQLRPVKIIRNQVQGNSITVYGRKGEVLLQYHLPPTHGPPSIEQELFNPHKHSNGLRFVVGKRKYPKSGIIYRIGGVSDDERLILVDQEQETVWATFYPPLK